MNDLQEMVGYEIYFIQTKLFRRTIPRITFVADFEEATLDEHLTINIASFVSKPPLPFMRL